jgi:hypothetical protein
MQNNSAPFALYGREINKIHAITDGTNAIAPIVNLE